MDNQKRKIEPVFVVGVILFVFAIGVYAYNGYLNRKLETMATTSNGLTPPTSGVNVYGTSSVNTTIAAPVNSPTPPTSSTTTTTTTSITPTTTNTDTNPMPTSPTMPATSPTLAVDCNANIVDGSVSWQGAGGSLDATAKITNRGGSPCELSGFPLVAFISGSTVLTATQKDTGAGASIVLQPSASAYLHFTWSNWCKGSSVPGIQARIVFAGNDGYLQIPVIGANGSPQTDTPACVSSSQNSMISVDSYSQS
jgi:hypothetical protein